VQLVIPFCLWLCVGPLPLLEKESISSVAKYKIKSEIYLEQPLYCHWYGLSLYNLMHQLERKLQNGKEITVQFRGVSYDFNRDILNECSKDIKGLCRPDIWKKYCSSGLFRDKELRGCEMTFSSLLSIVLSRLVFPGSRASFVHQGPIRKRPNTPGNPEVADIIAIDTKTSNYVFVSDLKKCDLELAEKETALCAKHASLSRDKNPESCHMILGLAGCTTSASLWLYVMAEEILWALPIATRTPWSMALLATISIAVANLVDTPRKHVALKTPLPFLTTMSPMKKGPRCRVFHDSSTDYIFKLFCQHNEIFCANTELMKDVGIKVSEENLTDDGMYYYIKYPYIRGNHTPKSLKQFHGIISMLHKVHAANFVHCDVRIDNLIFDENKQGSYLLDYDLAKKNRAGCYPLGYYSDPSFSIQMHWKITLLIRDMIDMP